MIRRRLTPTVTDYQRPRRNSDWKDSVFRLNVTAGVIAYTEPQTVADPACGDNSVLDAAFRLRPFDRAYVADISAPNIDGLRPSFTCEKWVGPVEETLSVLPPVDTMVMTEILEHLDDPDAVLRRVEAGFLVASSPNLEPKGYTNPEHVWEWDTEAYAEMLRETGWRPMALTLLDLPFVRDELHHVPTQTQIWLARSLR